VAELSGRVTLLDENLRPVGHPVQLDQPVINVAAGPDGGSAVALTGFDSASPFWVGTRDHWAVLDLSSGTVVREADLGFEARSVDFSPDGRHFAVGGGPDALEVLDATTGQPVSEFTPRAYSVGGVTYSADGSRVLTSGDDASDALWDGVTGELLARVSMPERFTWAGFGDDADSVVIVAQQGGPIYLWDSRPERAVDFACRIAGRDFTENEWSEHFGERPFQETCP